LLFDKTILQGIQNALPNSNVIYDKGCGITGGAEDFKSISENIKGSEVIIYVGGVSPRIEGEGIDRRDIEIPEVQRKLVQNLKTLGLFFCIYLLILIIIIIITIIIIRYSNNLCSLFRKCSCPYLF
jgi:beta-glucosidase